MSGVQKRQKILLLRFYAVSKYREREDFSLNNAESEYLSVAQMPKPRACERITTHSDTAKKLRNFFEICIDIFYSV